MNIEELKRQVDFFYENATIYGFNDSNTEVVIAVGHEFVGIETLFKERFLTIVPMRGVCFPNNDIPNILSENNALKEEISILKEKLKNANNPITPKRPKKIAQVLEKFPESENFWLRESDSNGIGTVCTLDVETETNGIRGIFRVEIFGVDDW